MQNNRPSQAEDRDTPSRDAMLWLTRNSVDIQYYLYRINYILDIVTDWSVE